MSPYTLASGCRLPTTYRLEETVGWTFGYGCQGIIQFPSSKIMAYNLSIHPWKPHEILIPSPAQEKLKRRTSKYSLHIFQMRFFCGFAYIIVNDALLREEAISYNGIIVGCQFISRIKIVQSYTFHCQ